MTIQTKDFAAPFNKYFNIKKSLSWKMEAFFTTPEQRAQNIKNMKRVHRLRELWVFLYVL